MTRSSSWPAFTGWRPPVRWAWPRCRWSSARPARRRPIRAVENIARKQLNPYEEAKAVRAMLDRGLTETGTAQALGWPKARVSARVKVLELPERAPADDRRRHDRLVRG